MLPMLSLSRYAPLGNAALRFNGLLDLVLVSALPAFSTSDTSFTISCWLNFRAHAPRVTSVTPARGITTGGTPITITGEEFYTGARVDLGGVPATHVNVVNSTLITATTPPSGVGQADIVVTNPDGQSGVLASGYGYVTLPSPPALAPTVTGISPNTGPASGGTTVTLSGTAFAQGAAVFIGGVRATVTSTSSTSIVATAPARGAGIVDVVVVNPDLQVGALRRGFVYTGPAPVNTAPNYKMGVLAIMSKSSPDTTLFSWLIDASVTLHASLQGTENVLNLQPFANQWVFVTSVYDAHLMTLSTYINGGVLQVTENVCSAVSLNPGALVIGRTGSATSPYFSGQLGRMRLWNAALDVKAMDVEMNSTHIGWVAADLGPFSPYLLGSWRMTEGYGDIAFDYARPQGSNAILGGGEENRKPEWVFANPNLTPF